MLILIDGISGSGKTTLGNQLGELFHVPVLHLDSWYPGWEGLEAGSRIAEEIAAGKRNSYPRWDWQENRVSEEVPFDVQAGLIMEGCGAITPETSRFSNLSIWLEAPADLARQRAAQREGVADVDWWDGWNTQEVEHWERDSPSGLATVVIQVSA